MHLRWLLLIVLVGTHAVAMFFAPSKLAPAVAGTVYVPLMALQAVGMPVFGNAESGGWPTPSPLGWFMVVVLWLAVWWAVALLTSRFFARRGDHA
jgi:hypothetical protein